MSIARSLKELDLPFEFLDAVDGRPGGGGLSERYEPLINRNTTACKETKMVDTEFACALSHLAAYQKVVERGVSYALILEDDALPQRDLVEYLAGRYFEDAAITSLYYGATFILKRSAKPVLRHYKSYLVPPKVDLPGAAGYIISRRAAQHILQHAIPVEREADWPLATEVFRQQKSWRLVYPRLIGHEHRTGKMGHSIIDDSGRALRRPYKRRFLGIYIPPAHFIMHSWLRRILSPITGMKKIRW